MPFISPFRLAALAAAPFALGIVSAADVQAAASTQGVWIDSNGRGAVEIKPCGNALCGHVVWVKSTTDAKGCGRQIIGDAVPSGGRGAHEGWIYSPEDHKRYNVEISPTSDGRLKVVGYAGMKLFSKTMYWTAASPDLARCDTVQAKAEPAPQTPPSATTPPAPAPKVSEQAPQPKAATNITPPSSAGNSPASTLATRRPEIPAAKPLPASPEPNKAAPPPADEADSTEAQPAAKPDLKKLADVLDKVISRSNNGDCNLDLPWLKVRFRCERD